MTLSANGQLRFPSLIKIFTMKAIYKVLALSGLAFAACDEGDYNDWVVPETTQDATEDEKLSSGFSATPADAINFETLGGLAVDYDTVFVKLFTPVLTGNTPDAVSYTIQLGSQEVFELDSTLLVPASYVKAAVESEFGKAPVERTLSATVCATETLGSIATKHKATVEVKATLVAPAFEDYLYYAGDVTSWQSNAQPLLGDGNGNYTGYYYIKKADADKKLYGFKFTNGIGKAATTWYGGKDGALDSGDNISPDEDGFYQIDANLADNTYKITKIETISIIGSVVLKEDGTADTKWGTDAVMEYDEASMAFVYEGKLAAGEFKFRADKGWTLNWGNGTNGLTSKDGGNIKLDADGTYKITFAPRCDEMCTYTIEPVTE